MPKNNDPTLRPTRPKPIGFKHLLALALAVSALVVSGCASGKKEASRQTKDRNCSAGAAGVDTDASSNEMFRRFLLAVSRHMEYGWKDAVPVSMAESSARDFEEYDAASRISLSQKAVLVLMGEHLPVGMECKDERFTTSTDLKDFKEDFLQNQAKGERTYAIRLGVLGDDIHGQNYASFQLTELQLNASSGNIVRSGEMVSLECIIVGNDKWGYRLIVASVAKN